MTISRNNAFAGSHVAPDGERFEVTHLSKEGVGRAFQDNAPPGHPDHLRAGWYWFGAGTWTRTRYTSSRLAYEAATARHSTPKTLQTPDPEVPMLKCMTEIKYTTPTGIRKTVTIDNRAPDLTTAATLALQHFRASSRGRSATKLDTATWPVR